MIPDTSLQKTVEQTTSGKLSPDELVDFSYQQIDKCNPSLNAIVSLRDKDEVKKEAKALSNEAKKKHRLLYGIPLAIKDLFNVKELPTTFGLPMFKNNIAKKHSILVDRLINHGALILGKTNIPELALGSHTKNKLFGATSNAFNNEKSAGGSSGGAASAVASSMIPIADGSDMMGSCRNPAAFSNLYGFRPTPGLIPEDRVLKIDTQFPLLSTPGCLAKTPGDMGIFLDAVSGLHALDPFSFDIEGSFKDVNFHENEFSKMRVGWLGNMNGQYSFEDGILDLCETTLKHLDGDYLSIDDVVDEIDASMIWDSWTTLRSRNVYLYLKESNLQDNSDLGEGAQYELKKGKQVTEGDLKRSMEKRSVLAKKIDRLFDTNDFLALPSAQVFPFDKELDYPSIISEKDMQSYHHWMEVVTLSSLLGLPTISIPVGFNKNNLPMGMQIIGRKKEDLRVLSFAKKYEQIFQFSNVKSI
ncbi:MAG TPA: amidase [Gammaproteobacteria bacterium]|nr:amidase [Gammaproteobacteria bacterium]